MKPTKLSDWNPKATCQTCRYWSEMIAEAVGGGPVRALCLNPAAPPREGVGGLDARYRAGSESCAEHEAGTPIGAPS